MSAPFAKAKILMSAVAAILASGLGPAARQSALGELPAYRSRGHGRGVTSYSMRGNRRGGNNGGLGEPHQASQECLRRLRGGWAVYGGGGRLTKRQALDMLDRGAATFSELSR